MRVTLLIQVATRVGVTGYNGLVFVVKEVWSGSD